MTFFSFTYESGHAYVVYLSLCMLFSCKSKEKGSDPLFTLMDNTNIQFENKLTPSKNFNVFTYRNFYNGGGAAIGDLNNDGLAGCLLYVQPGSQQTLLQ